MLTSFIPKLFGKESNISQYELLKKIYNHSFKNGWSVYLNDNTFNKYYKIITGYHHININYNRNFIDKPNYDDNKDCLRDFITFKLLKNNDIKKKDINHFNNWHNQYNYDTEGIIYDTLIINNNELSNINDYITSSSSSITINKIENIINTFNKYGFYNYNIMKIKIIIHNIINIE